MEATISLDIAGLAVIFYSPFAASHIARGEDYLSAHFWQAADVAQMVNACQISALGTGSPGRFLLKLYDGPIDAGGVEAAGASGRLGIEVRDGHLCFRDLYDLMEWEPECAEAQTVRLPNGFYRVTVYTSLPSSGVLGDDQTVWLHFEPCLEKPAIWWAGVPTLVPE